MKEITTHRTGSGPNEMIEIRGRNGFYSIHCWGESGSIMQRANIDFEFPAATMTPEALLAVLEDYLGQKARPLTWANRALESVRDAISSLQVDKFVCPETLAAPPARLDDPTLAVPPPVEECPDCAASGTWGGDYCGECEGRGKVPQPAPLTTTERLLAEQHGVEVFHSE